MSEPISQREAQRLRREVEGLKGAERQRRNNWATQYPGGTHLTNRKWEPDSDIVAMIRTARKLKHAVVVTADDSGVVHFFALPLGSEPL